MLWKVYNLNIKYVPVNDYDCDIDTKRDYEDLVKYINNRDNLIVDKIKKELFYKKTYKKALPLVFKWTHISLR